MIVLQYRGDSCIEIQEKGQNYMYIGVIPQEKKTIDTHIAKGRPNKAWQILKKHTCVKEGDDE